jgi:hypothetical protein
MSSENFEEERKEKYRIFIVKNEPGIFESFKVFSKAGIAVRPINTKDVRV